ncbi:somatomedin-B and thrombospondin type-1 domain-containing protein-like [Babylonia areolata]|uniref:somatomedin-B and thrombospondin type-1 domain-containing protein-like n=1 Tax=Babylonia areolata TaxID=304850 RepID=UPI003FD62EA1
MGLSGRLLTALCTVVILCIGLHDCRPERGYPRSCGEKQLCCPGQNNTCYAFGPRVDRSEDSDRCYCDSNCLIMGDCCMDYAHVCKAQDCSVDTWGPWSKCSNPCGFGKRLRYRAVRMYPENGGRHCPMLKQRRACVGFEEEQCAQQSLEFQAEELQERAHILPLELGVYRTMKKYDPWKGILKNLYDRYFNEIFTRATYCGHFKVLKTNAHCLNSEWAKDLRVNSTVCVECQPVAMNREIGMRCMGHGVSSHVTTWKAVDVAKCHGQWELTDQHLPCTCHPEHQPSFIFL